jgi:hypothetical protein
MAARYICLQQLIILQLCCLAQCAVFYNFDEAHSQEHEEEFFQTGAAQPSTEQMQLLSLRFVDRVNVMVDNVLKVELELDSPNGLNDGYDFSIMPSQVSPLFRALV